MRKLSLLFIRTILVWSCISVFSNSKNLNSNCACDKTLNLRDKKKKSSFILTSQSCSCKSNIKEKYSNKIGLYIQKGVRILDTDVESNRDTKNSNFQMIQLPDFKVDNSKFNNFLQKERPLMIGEIGTHVPNPGENANLLNHIYY
jgi:hypothetical protein